MSDANPEKKIIIDEDWKSQVQAEKEALERQQAPQPTESAAEGAAPGAAAEEPQMPPASFEALVTTLATEAMFALGQIPHPETGQAERRPQQARYLIDTLEMLAEKTKGNLTPAEERMLDTILHQLRMAFVTQ